MPKNRVPQTTITGLRSSQIKISWIAFNNYGLAKANKGELKKMTQGVWIGFCEAKGNAKPEGSGLICRVSSSKKVAHRYYIPKGYLIVIGDMTDNPFNYSPFYVLPFLKNGTATKVSAHYRRLIRLAPNRLWRQMPQDCECSFLARVIAKAPLS